MLTDTNLDTEREHPSQIGGVQRLYRLGDWGLSLVNSPVLHSYSFAWEAAVLRFAGNDFTLTYKTPLTNDVETFANDEEANEFIVKAFEWFASHPENVTDEE